MTTVYVDLVNLDGSRPEGALRFVLERMVLGDPDVVPSSVEARIRDGRARVEGLLPGDMRVRVSAGDWSKSWHIKVPESGEHDLFDLLEWQAEDFQETVWAELAKRVEALENTPSVDLAPLEERVTELESKPAPEPFDPSALQAQLAEMQAHLTPVDLSWLDEVAGDIDPVFATGSAVGVVQHAGRVDISFRNSADMEGLIRALDGLDLPHFPEVAHFPDGGWAPCSVELSRGAKFLTKLEASQIRLTNWSGPLRFQMNVDDVMEVVREVGADRMTLSTFYYTEAPPPPELLS